MTGTRRNGYVSLKVVAGSAYSPDQQWLDVGLPFGPKPRLVLYHLNAEAKRNQSPLIDLEDSLTAFVRRTLGLDPGGRNIRVVKDQLTRLSAADFRFGLDQEGRGVTIKGTVIEGFELWMPKNDKQRVARERADMPAFPRPIAYTVPTRNGMHGTLVR